MTILITARGPGNTLLCSTIKTRPESAPTLTGPLTHSLDRCKEGLAMNATQVEEWRPIPGHEESYEASSLGRIRSVSRTVVRSNGVPMRVRERILREYTNPRNRYLYVSLHLSTGEQKTCAVHRLVAHAFHGLPLNEEEVCHNNGDRSDARAVNLRWDTHSANGLDKRKDGTDHNVNKVSCPLGHAYVGANLQPRRVGAGRKCRSCNRASAKFNTGDPRFRIEADYQYRRLNPCAA